MRQSVMLTSLSLSTFDEALDAICIIQNMFRQYMTDGTMEEWAPSIFQEHSSIDVGN
jgi:predicted phage tail protein